MSYTTSEQETVITYDNDTRLFDVYSTVPKHCRRLLKKYHMSEFMYILMEKGTNPYEVRIQLKKLPSASTFNA